MNDRQRRFAQLVFKGRPAGRAYEEAGYKSKGEVADTCAAKLLRTAKVASYLKELREKAETKEVMNGRQIREFYTKIIKDPKARQSDQLRASDLLNKMDQNYAPERIEHSGSGIDNLFSAVNSKAGVHNEGEL